MKYDKKKKKEKKKASQFFHVGHSNKAMKLAGVAQRLGSDSVASGRMVNHTSKTQIEDITWPLWNTNFISSGAVSISDE